MAQPWRRGRVFLLGWLRAKGGPCALVRPDRIVAAVGEPSALAHWARALRATGVR